MSHGKLPVLTQDLRIPDSGLREPAPSWIKGLVVLLYASILACLCTAAIDGYLLYSTKSSVAEKRKLLSDTKSTIAQIKSSVESGERTQRVTTSLNEFTASKSYVASAMLFSLRTPQKINDLAWKQYEEGKKAGKRVVAPKSISMHSMDVAWRPEKRSWVLSLGLAAGNETLPLLSRDLAVPPAEIGRASGIDIKSPNGETRLSFTLYPPIGGANP